MNLIGERVERITHNSPSSTSSLRDCRFRLMTLAVPLRAIADELCCEWEEEEDAGEGTLSFLTAGDSSSEESPARARSSASRSSAMVN